MANELPELTPEENEHCYTSAASFYIERMSKDAKDWMLAQYDSQPHSVSKLAYTPELVCWCNLYNVRFAVEGDAQGFTPGMYWWVIRVLVDTNV